MHRIDLIQQDKFIRAN